MAAPKWFDYATYKANKLAQLQQLDSSWTQTKMEAAFTNAGFTGTDGYFNHFQKYGHTEDVSPNKLFSAEYYYKAKALQFYTSEAGGSIAEATVKDKLDYYADQVKGLINNAGMDAWTHYIKYGTAEGINPSNDFDTSAYMAAKLEALQTAEPSAGWTEETMNAAFKKAGLNALEHFMVYAGNGNANEVAEGMAADGTVPTAYVVPADEQISDDSQVTSFQFTTAIDKFTGTNTDDVFTGDNSGNTDTVTDGDSADGKGGNDTFDYYLNGGTALSAATMPTIKNIETVKFNKIDLTGNDSFDASKLTDVTAISLVKSGAAMVNGVTQTMTMGSNQSLSLVDIDVANGATGTFALKGLSAITLDGSGVDKTNTGTLTLNVDDNNVKAFEINSVNNANAITFADANNKVAEMTVTGDAALAVSTGETTVKTVDASAMTNGGLSYNLTAIADASFKFTGSSANDELGLVATSLATLTSGDQLDGGDGKDKLSIGEDGSTNKFDYTDLAKVKSFEVLGLTAATAVNLDASKIGSTFTEISVDKGLAAHTITNLANGFTVDVPVTQTGSLEITPKATGQTNITINLGHEGLTADLAVTAATIGFNNVTLHSIAKDGSVTNTITTLNNVDGSTYTIDGVANLTITNATQATNAASKYDASALTGNLTITGNAASYASGTFTKLGDTIIGGSGDDIITASVVGGELTGGSGKDTFDVSASFVKNAAAAADKMVVTTITDFNDKGDNIVLGSGGSLNAKATTIKSGLSLDKIVQALDEDLTAQGVAWGNDGTDTYLLYSKAGAIAADDDVVVKLSGIVDLSDADFTGGVLTHA